MDDPTSHQPASRNLIRDGIKYAASAKTIGFYLALGHAYINGTADEDIEMLSEFGKFRVRLVSMDDVHIVAAGHKSVIDPIPFSDAGLINWGNSIHALFTAYPPCSSVKREFKPVVVQKGDQNIGAKTFSDNSKGTPYTIASD